MYKNFFFYIKLLGSDRLSILAANLEVAFLLFESQREHLKFQMEQFIIKLMDLVDSDSSKILYEQRELALGKYNRALHVYQKIISILFYFFVITFYLFICRNYCSIMENTWFYCRIIC